MWTIIIITIYTLFSEGEKELRRKLGSKDEETREMKEKRKVMEEVITKIYMR